MLYIIPYSVFQCAFDNHGSQPEIHEMLRYVLKNDFIGYALDGFETLICAFGNMTTAMHFCTDAASLGHL